MNFACAEEGEYCTCNNGTIYFGIETAWVHTKTENGAMCEVNSFDSDPAFGETKTCQCQAYTCAQEENYCTCDGTIYFGRDPTWVSMETGHGLMCQPSTFGFDPAPGQIKTCECHPHGKKQFGLFIKSLLSQ